MLIRDCMTPTPLLTVTLKESLQGAMELMAMKRIRHLPVLDDDGALIGLVSDRDVRRAAPSPLFGGDGSAEQSLLDSTPVERIMTRSPATVGPEQRLQDAISLMVDKKYGALPVVAGGGVVDILTTIDVMKAFLRLRP